MPPTPDAPTEVIPLVTGPPRRRRPLRWLVAGLLAAALAGGAAVLVVRHRSAAPPAGPAPLAVETAAVERRTLTTTRSLTGRIGFGAARPLAGHREATVTWLPPAGATIKRGKQLFRADDRPVLLFYGGMPLYRDITGTNLIGRDVRIIADNLTTLGYGIGRQPSPGEWITQPAPSAPGSGSNAGSGDGSNAGEGSGSGSEAGSGSHEGSGDHAEGTPGGGEAVGGAGETGAGEAAGATGRTGAGSAVADKKDKTASVRLREGEGVLTARLRSAIMRWQTDNGLPATGTIAVGDVEVQSGAVRVESVAVQPGSPANAELMAVTSTRKVVTVDAELADAASIRRGDKVEVVLPAERTVKGRVLSVGRTLAQPGDAIGSGPPTLAVTITADDPASLADLDAADVEVAFAGKTAADVLAVPVEALVALTEGGYAVQGPGGLVAVRTGMFADGWVEVDGAGLTEGVGVVVAS